MTTIGALPCLVAAVEVSQKRTQALAIVAVADTLWLGRAHSIGHARQLLNLLGYALMVNGLALHRHQRRRTHLAA